MADNEREAVSDLLGYLENVRYSLICYIILLLLPRSCDLTLISDPLFWIYRHHQLTS